MSISKFEAIKSDDIDSILCTNSYCSIDVETTGLSQSDRIIEISIIKYFCGDIVEDFSTFVNYNGSIPYAARLVNNISESDLIGAPSYSDIAPIVQHLLDNSIIIGHNVTFDLGLIDILLEESGLSVEAKYINTLSLSRRMDFGLPSHELDIILPYHGITRPVAHRARADAQATAELFEAYKKTLSEINAWAVSFKKERRKQCEAEYLEKYCDAPLFKKTFVFTGEFENGRENMEALAQLCGAIVKNSITKKTDYLVLGDVSAFGGLTGKLRTAQALIEDGGSLIIIGEQDFLDMAKGK